jgi:hypothetical protein
MDHDDFYEDPIDSFMYHESDNIIDLYYEMENRFPYFLNNMKSSDLYCFIIDKLITNKKGKCNQDHILYFEQEYKTEINVTLMLLNNYLYKFKKFSIHYDDWLNFCCGFTTF